MNTLLIQATQLRLLQLTTLGWAKSPSHIEDIKMQVLQPDSESHCERWSMGFRYLDISISHHLRCSVISLRDAYCRSRTSLVVPSHA